MPELPNLRCLNLTGTQISNLVGMPELPCLKRLTLKSTPFSRAHTYLRSVTRNRDEVKNLRKKAKEEEKINELLNNFDETDITASVIKKLIGQSRHYSDYDTETGSNDMQTIKTSNSQFGKLFDPTWGESSFVNARYRCLGAVYANHRIRQIISFNSNSPDSYYLNLNLVLCDPNTGWFIELVAEERDVPLWDSEWQINIVSIKGQLRWLIGHLFGNDTRLLEVNSKILGLPTGPPHGAFFDRLLTTAEGRSDTAAMIQRMYSIILHLFTFHQKDPGHCNDIIMMMSNGSASCVDRVALALSSIENEIAFFTSETETQRLSVAINAYKLHQISLKVQINWETDRHGTTDELEDVLYHTLLLKDTLGIKTKTTRMRWDGCAGEKIPFTYALDQIVQDLNVDKLLYFMARWLPIQRYYGENCPRVSEAYDDFDEEYSYDHDDYEAHFYDFIRKCALEGLMEAGYVVNNPFYEVEGIHQEI